jgi:hypothetical protein
MERNFPGRSPSFGRGLLARPFASGRSGPLTLDVAKMYRDNIAPDPGSLLRGYGGSSAGAGVFISWPAPLAAFLPERAVPLRRYLLLALYVAPDRLPARQFVTDLGVGYGQYRLAPSGHRPGRYGRPQDRAPVSNRGLLVPVDRRRMISTGVGGTLVMAGSILRFAVPATFTCARPRVRCACPRRSP